MKKKTQGILLITIGIVNLFLAIFSDYLRSRPFSLGLAQIGLLLVSLIIVYLGFLIYYEKFTLSIDKVLNLFRKGYTYITYKINQTEIEIKNPVHEFLFIWGICLFLASIFLLICTKSSPIYPFNDWADSNSYFTMGKGMMEGKVLYRDLFEQKGPLLYLIHGLAYLISNNTFLGVYIFEVISFSFFLFYFYKILALFFSRIYSLVTMPLISSGILNLLSFSHGDSAEEFSLPVLTISLYYLINYFKNVYPQPVQELWLFFNGLLAGCVLWIKFPLLGFWFGWMASLFFCMIAKKHVRKAILGSIIFLSGMLITTIPWIIYFGINNSIPDWLHTYITINATLYPKTTTFYGIFKNSFLAIREQVFNNPMFCGLLLLGVVVFITNKRFIRSRLNRFLLMICITFLVLSVYGGGLSFVYYFLILSPFVVFGYIIVMDLYLKEYGVKRPIKYPLLMLAAMTIVLLPFTLQNNHNTYMLKFDEKDLVQYKFEYFINQAEKPTLLNYGFLDMGFFTTTGIVPNVKYFSRTNIKYSKFPEMENEQNRYIKEKIVKFVVLRQEDPNVYYHTIPYLEENYRLVETKRQLYENKVFYYVLYERID